MGFLKALYRTSTIIPSSSLGIAQMLQNASSNLFLKLRKCSARLASANLCHPDQQNQSSEPKGKSVDLRHAQLPSSCHAASFSNSLFSGGKQPYALKVHPTVANFSSSWVSLTMVCTTCASSSKAPLWGVVLLLWKPGCTSNNKHRDPTLLDVIPTPELALPITRSPSLIGQSDLTASFVLHYTLPS